LEKLFKIELILKRLYMDFICLLHLLEKLFKIELSAKT
jgi:hypothetical protein